MLSWGMFWLDFKFWVVSDECGRLEDENRRLRRDVSEQYDEIQALKAENQYVRRRYKDAVEACESRLSEIKEKLGQFVCEAVALEYQLFPESEGDKDNVPF